MSEGRTVTKVFEAVHPTRLEMLLRVYNDLGCDWEIYPNGRYFTVVFTRG